MVSRLLIHPHAPDANGTILDVSAATAGWRYVSFMAHQLEVGQTISRDADGSEVLVLLLEGWAEVYTQTVRFTDVGSRQSVFDGPPAGQVLIAPGVPVSIVAVSHALVVVAAAPHGTLARTALIRPEQVTIEYRGEGSTLRRVHHLLPSGAEAGRLLAFEVYTPGGNWSSYPPHKHDTEDPPREAYLEELYFYRFARPHGYALQRVYTPDRALNELLAPEDGDLVLVPAGYHVVGAPAGYDCYYLNIMAGPNRAWNFTVDPDHAWLMNWDPAAPSTGAREKVGR